MCDVYTVRPSTVVLCIDDDREQCALLREWITGRGEYVFISAHTGADASRIAKTSAVDIYLLDYHLPDMLGPDLCHAIRAFDRVTPILFCSGETRDEARRAAFEAGATAYLTKPLNFSALMQQIALLAAVPATLSTSAHDISGCQAGL